MRAYKEQYACGLLKSTTDMHVRGPSQVSLAYLILKQTDFALDS